MSKLRLTFACGLYDRMLALYTGEAPVEGVDLNFLVEDNPRNIFDRMAGGLEFDACEFSSSEYISRFVADDCPFTALPVFPSRVFRHSFIFVNRKHINSPADLNAARIGVPRYTMTAAIVQRGLLMDEHRLDFEKATWIEGDVHKPGLYGNPTILPPVKPIAIEANTSAYSLSDLLDRGDIQALIGTEVPACFGTNPDIVRLYPDYRAAETDYFRRTGIFPIMHMIVVRKDVLAANPFLATSLCDAFERSKAIEYKKMRYRGTLRNMLPFMHAELDDIARLFGGDPWPYGIEPNRKPLEAVVRWLHEQGVIARRVPIEDLFASVRPLMPH